MEDPRILLFDSFYAAPDTFEHSSNLIMQVHVEALSANGNKAASKHHKTLYF